MKLLPGNGKIFNVGRHKTLMVEVYGTATSRTVEFKGAGPGGTFYPIVGSKIAEPETKAVNTTGIGELWRFDVSGLMSVRMEITAIAGGYLAIKGRAVA